MVQFTDAENDRIIINIQQNDLISSFVQKVANSTNDYNIILQANDVSDSPVDFVLNYTDIYHQDDSDFMSIIFPINLFAVEPPVFSEQLKQLNANRWTDFYISLPDIIDSSGLNWTVALGLLTPNWIKLNSNNSLTLLTSDLSFNIPEITNID